MARIILNRNLGESKMTYDLVSYSDREEEGIKEENEMYDKVMAGQKYWGEKPRKIKRLHSSASGVEVLEYGCTGNGFTNTFVTAYNTHQDLILRPDDIFQAINTSVAKFVDKNAEELRRLFVSHEGKKELKVFWNSPDWDAFSDLMEQEIQKNINVKLDMMPEFSTTTQAIHTTACITTMATLKKYFDYKFMLGCGIPAVQLEGTVADWEKLQEKYEALKELLGHTDLKRWFVQMDPVVKMFVDMRRLAEGTEGTDGEVDGTDDMINMWSRVITTIPYGSGSQRYISGWIQLFFAWDKKLPETPLFDLYRSNADVQAVKDTEWVLQDIQGRGTVDTPVTLVFPDGKEWELELTAGFLGTEKLDSGFRPLIGYNVDHVLGKTE